MRALPYPVTSLGDGYVLEVGEADWRVVDRPTGEILRSSPADDLDAAIDELKEAVRDADTHPLPLDDYGVEVSAAFWRDRHGIGCDLSGPGDERRGSVHLSQVVGQTRSLGIAGDGPYDTWLDSAGDVDDLMLKDEGDLDALLTRVASWYAWMHRLEPERRSPTP